MITDISEGEPVVIDLRFSDGGDLHEAVDAASFFVAPGQVVTSIQDRSGEQIDVRTIPQQTRHDGPIIVLVSERTASSAEVFARALLHYSAAKLSGRKTHGKCVSQEKVLLSDGDALFLTSARLFDPTGTFCDEEGIEPTYATDQSPFLDTQGQIDRVFAGLAQASTYICLMRPVGGDQIATTVAAMEIRSALDLTTDSFVLIEDREGERRVCHGPLPETVSIHADELARQYSEKLEEDFEARYTWTIDDDD